MTANDFEQEVPVSAYGAARAAAWHQHLVESMEASTEASMASHRADSAILRAAHQGLYGHATPQEMGAAVQARAATVGDAYGQGRPLERQGGTFDHAAESPAPARVDLRFVDRQGQAPGVSPLLAHMRGRS